MYIRYITINNEYYYSLRDICSYCNLDYYILEKEISFIGLLIKFPKSNGNSFFVNQDALKTVLEKNKSNNFLHSFYSAVIRNSFGEESYHKKRNSIWLDV